jgi:hypothetical protein
MVAVYPSYPNGDRTVSYLGEPGSEADTDELEAVDGDA